MITKIIVGTSEHNLYMTLWWFFIYSIIGWTIESIYMSICNRQLTNRGFIHGPICPIYGVGAMIIYALLEPLDNNYVAIYIVGALLANIVEYLCACVTLRLFDCVWWDYTNKPFNYKGILCLESTIVWGLYCVLEFAVLHDFIYNLVMSIPKAIGTVMLTAITLYFIADMTLCLYKRIRGIYIVEAKANNILRRDVN